MGRGYIIIIVSVVKIRLKTVNSKFIQRHVSSRCKEFCTLCNCWLKLKTEASVPVHLECLYKYFGDISMAPSKWMLTFSRVLIKLFCYMLLHIPWTNSMTFVDHWKTKIRKTFSRTWTLYCYKSDETKRCIYCTSADR